jgi:NAD(P)-dependent dehydrogenase (short-subunit alcohol dehydrogenase family)
MTITLITGANKGLGHQTARELLAAGHDVWVGARDEHRGRAAAEELGARFVQLDVTDDASVAAAVATVEAEAGRLDVLVNNAGIADTHKPQLEVTGDELLTLFDTNVAGVLRVAHAFLPLLERSERPVVVNVSSGLGSFAVTSTPGRIESTVTALTYPASKSAVNMLTTQWARLLPRFRVNAVDPGYTATDLNGRSGTQTVEEGAEAIVRLAQVEPDGPTGGFFDRHGTLPW